MPNPPMVVRDSVDADGRVIARICWLWCPGCSQMHPVHIPAPDGARPNRPTWEWDGNVEQPTFSPSLLCYSSAHLCGDEHLVPCAGGECGHLGHRVLEDGSLAVGGPHTADPAWGNCHSFIRAGRWEFLSDCAHELAGQTVPLPPIPDWWLG